MGSERETTEIETGWWQKPATTSAITGILTWMLLWLLKVEIGFFSGLGLIILTFVGLIVVHFVNATVENQDDWLGNIVNALLLIVFAVFFALCVPGLSIEKIKQRTAERLEEGAQQLRNANPTQGQLAQPSVQGNAQSQTVQPQVPVQNAQPQAPVQQLPAVQPSLPVVPAQTVPEPRLPAVTGVSYNGTTVTLPSDNIVYSYRLNEFSPFEQLKQDTKIDFPAVYVVGKDKNGLRVTEITVIQKTK